MSEHENRYVTPNESDEILGFWIYLMTDCVLFAALFAAHAVLENRFAGGLTGKTLFDMKSIGIETALLLSSSLAVGLAVLGLERRNKRSILVWLAITFVLGAGFIGMELHDFATMLAKGAGPDRSAFLSSFYALVATHGLHVFVGLIWEAVLMAQVFVFYDEITEQAQSRIVRFSLFWHFLDIVWICIFTFVYLRGHVL